MAAKKQLNFTKKAIHNLPTPDKGERPAYFDSQVKNLCLIVTDTGNKSFYVRKVIDRRSRRILLGKFPDLSISDARDKAMAVKTQIAHGENPFETRQRIKGEPSFAEFFEMFMEKHARVHKKTKSIEGDETNFRVHIKDELGVKKLSSITQEDIQRLHHKIGKNAKYAANRVLALISTVFSKSIEWGYIEKTNPAAYIKPFKEQSRKRFLQPDEIPTFFEALENEPNIDIRDYVLLSLYTGARKSNVLSMAWKDVSLKREQWRIPETKNGEPQIIPLIPQAVELLKQRHAKHEREKFVFPSKSKKGHLVEPKTGWKRIIQRAGIEDFRIHDLRRTLGSIQAANGVSLHIIGESLGHKSLTATKIYSQLSQDVVLRSMTDAVNTIYAQREKSDDQ